MRTPNADEVGQRWPEAVVAALLAAIGVLVIVDSVRVGTGWADDGPRSGYFPFYIGCLLVVSSGWVLLNQLMRWGRDSGVFAEKAQLMQVVAIGVPMVVHVALIYPLGIYVASVLLIGYFMRRYGGYGWLLIGGVSVGVPLVFFLVFERWFLVPLPKGPLERALGF